MAMTEVPENLDALLTRDQTAAVLTPPAFLFAPRPLRPKRPVAVARLFIALVPAFFIVGAMCSRGLNNA
jgi:hypothetical protein